MKYLLTLLICMLCISPLLHAEQGCPPGMVPEGGQGATSCRPIPGYNQGTPVAPGPQAVTYVDGWGAVAMDTYETANLGASHDKSSRAEAEKIAMENCLAVGSKKCELISTYSNGCVALAESGTRYGIASRLTLGEAQSEAVSQCNDATCKVVYSNCSKPKRI